MRRLARSFALAFLMTAVAAPARGATDANDLRSQQWALDKIGAPAAWPTADGAGVTVAVVDTGVDYAHDDLKGRLLPGHDFVGEDADHPEDDDAQDENGHGTHVAGIIAALHGNGGTDGVAPGAKILPVRVLDKDGSGTDDAVTAGIKWAVDHGAKVINLSLGDDLASVFGPALSDAVNEAWAAGAVCVVAAGNEIVGGSGVTTGSGFTNENAVVVTATNEDDDRPSYASGVGAAKWGIAAPGGDRPTEAAKDRAVVSTYWVKDSKDQYAYLAGTSQAAPHVSGALAILLSTGRFTVPQAVQRVLDTAKDLGTPGRDSLYGFGRLDIAAAMNNLQASGSPATTAAPSRRGPATTTANGSTATSSLTLPDVAAPTVLPDRPADSTAGQGPDVTVAASAPSAHHRSGRTIPSVIAALALAAVTVSAIRWWRGRRIVEDV